MNTYHKFVPNVFLAKCEEKHEKGDEILVTTKYGKENECIVFNLIFERDGFYYYSIVRADGFNVQEWARRKAERRLFHTRKAHTRTLPGRIPAAGIFIPIKTNIQWIKFLKQ